MPRPPTSSLFPPPDRWSEIPIIGQQWLGKVGRAITIASNPCATTPEIWVYAFFSAFPIALWTFVKPSPVDFLGEKFTNVARSKRKLKFTIWAETQPVEIPKPGLQWVAFKGIEFGRRIGWYITFADAVTGGLLNWVSTAYRYSGCTDAAHGGGYASGHALEDSVDLPGAGSGFYNEWISDSNFRCAVGPGGVAVPGGLIASVGMSLSSKPNTLGLPDATWSMEVVNALDDVVVASADTHYGLPGFASSTAFFANGLAYSRAANKARANGFYRARITKSAGALVFSSGSISATGSPLSDAITPDP